MRVAQQRLIHWVWILSLLVTFITPIVSCQVAQANTTGEQTLGGNEHGTVSAKYQVDQAQHTISWEVTMQQNAGEKERQIEFSANGQDGLEVPTELSVTGGNTEQRDGKTVSQSTKEARTYVAHFKTKYSAEQAQNGKLQIQYRVLQGSDSVELLKVDQPVAVPQATLKTNESQSSETENLVESSVSSSESASVSEESGEKQASSESSKVVASSDEGKQSSRESKRESSVTPASKAKSSSKTSTMPQKQSKSTRSLNASGKVTADSISEDLQFQTSSDSVGSHTLTKLSKDNQPSFRIDTDWVADIEYRTNEGSNNWQSLGSGWWGYSWSGSWSDLGTGNFENTLAPQHLANGNLKFTAKQQTEFLQFRVKGWLAPTLYSDKIYLKGKEADFSLTVPKLDFGRIQQFGENQFRHFNFELNNPKNRKFTLKATNQTRDSAQSNPFGRDDLLGVDQPPTLMAPEKAVTLVHQQTSIPTELPFSVNVPLNAYADGNYTTDINWQLTLDD